MFRKRTQEDRERLKQQFLSSNFGKWLIRNKPTIRIILSSICLIAFLILTVGTFIPYDWSIAIPYPLSIVMGSSYHGYTHYYTQSNIFEDIARTYIASHHLTDISLLWIFYYIFAIKTKSLIYPALLVCWVLGIHEYTWWYSYAIANSFNVWNYFSKLSGIYAVLMFLYIIIKGFNKEDIKWLLVLFLFYMIWIILGFHVTVGYNGPTQYFYDIWTILTEMISWLYAFVTYYQVVDWDNIKRKWI